jgi:hypothetical protein
MILMIKMYDCDRFVRHRNWIRPINVLRAVIILTIVMITWWTIYTAVVAPAAFGNPCESAAMTSTSGGIFFLNQLTTITMVYVIPCLIALAFLARGLAKQDNDAFGIRKELRSILILCSITATTAVVHITVGIVYWWTTFAGTVAMFAMFAPTILFPIYQSYEFQALQRKQASELQKVKTVEELLALPQGFELFVEYCQTVRLACPCHFYKCTHRCINHLIGILQRRAPLFSTRKQLSYRV